eukprot:11455553-Prorocentrum_lima.AAC.1
MEEQRDSHRTLAREWYQPSADWKTRYEDFRRDRDQRMPSLNTLMQHRGSEESLTQGRLATLQESIG